MGLAYGTGTAEIVAPVLAARSATCATLSLLVAGASTAG